MAAMSNTSNPTAVQLRRAANVAEKIEELQAELAAILGGSAPAKKLGRPAKVASAAAVAAAPAEAKPRKKRRKMSAEGLANIIAAQKARWAKVKKATPAK